MAAVYDQIKMKNGQVRYRKDKNFVGKDKIPQEVLESLTLENIVDENGTVIVEDKGDYAELSDEEKAKVEQEAQANNGVDQGAIDGNRENQETTAAVPALADPARTPDGDLNTPVATPSLPEGEAERVANLAPRLRSKTPQSTPGMGFPRKNGRTVDIFDGTTPHTHVKLVGGYAVPLSAENYKYRTESEIESRLREMGYDIVDFNKFEADSDTALEDEGNDDGLDEDNDV